MAPIASDGPRLRKGHVGLPQEEKLQGRRPSQTWQDYLAQVESTALEYEKFRVQTEAGFVAETLEEFLSNEEACSKATNAQLQLMSKLVPVMNSLDELISNRNYAMDFEDPTPRQVRSFKVGLEFDHLCRKAVILALVAVYVYTKYYFITAALNKVDTQPEEVNNDLYQWFAFRNSNDFHSRQAIPTWLSER